MTRVLICGLVTSACVLGTALGAFYRGMDVLLVEDCCADWSIERHEATVGMYSDYYELCSDPSCPVLLL